MADVIQTILPVGVKRIFQTIRTEPVRWKTSEPMGEMIFVADSDVVTATGVGDTATLRIRQDLPIGFLYRFTDMHVRIRGANADDWTPSGKFKFNFGIDTVATPSAQLDYVVSRTFHANLGVDINYRFGGFVDGITDFMPMDGPRWLINGRELLDTTNPTFEIRNTTNSSGPWVVAFLFRYLVFPIEQGLNSGLYWPEPVQNI